MNVLFREWRRMTSRRIYLGAAVVLPLFLIFFMATIFGTGQMERLPVGVVDADNTATSRHIVRQIAATPTLDVVARYADDAEARAAVSRREVYGYLSIPPQFEESMVRGTDATLCYYYHYALLAVGGEVMSAFETALLPVRMAPIVDEAIMLGDTEANIETFLLPMTADGHALYNPSLDYAVYLAVPIFYIMFQILILLVTIYAIGSERKEGSRRSMHDGDARTMGKPDWLASADGSILRAVVGKLLPYTLIFTAEVMLAGIVFFHWEHIPLAGDWWLLFLVALLFIVATQSVAVILYALLPVLSIVISIVSMVGSLGATLSGLTFPLSAMSPVVQAVARLFPVRHFTEAMQGIVYFGAGYPTCWPQLAVLCLFPLVAVVLLKIRGLPQEGVSKCSIVILSKAKDLAKSVAETIERCFIFVQHDKRKRTCRVLTHPHGGGFFFLHVAWREFRTIATSYSVLLVLVGGVFAYGLLYNYMYAPNVVREVPVCVVDHSHSALSREYIRLLDATPEASVAYHDQDMLAAKRRMLRAEVYGVLYLPRDFEERLLRGEPSVYPFYATTDAFLYYESLERANLGVMEAMDGEYRTQLIGSLSLGGLAAVATQSPVTVVGTALYNPIEGYGVYLIPSVLMIIIFQTLMMLVAMTSNRRSEAPLLAFSTRLCGHRTRLAISLVCGKTLTYAVFYAIFALFLVGMLPLLFDIPHGASWGALTALLIPYILGTSFLGLALSRWYADAEAPILLIAFFSIGLIFLSGVSYPLELIPWYWQVVHYLIPAAPAVLAYVQLSCMEGTLHDVWPQLLALYAQMVVYFALAVRVYHGKRMP